MKKSILVVAVILIIVVVFWVIRYSGVSTDSSLKVGVILPLTGTAQATGELSKKAIELALSDMSDDLRNGIQVIYEDDQFDTKLTIAAAQKLINVDMVDVLITFSAASSLGVVPIAEQKEIPLIGIGNSEEINLGKNWAVRFIPSSAEQASALESLILRGKYKKVAIIWNQSDGPKAIHDNLLKSMQNKDYIVTGDESVAKTENDFRTAISKLKSTNPEVVVGDVYPQIGIFAKQAKDIGWNVPLVSTIIFESVNQIEIATGALANQEFVGTDNIKFLDRFHEKYGIYPATAGDHLYDAVIRLAEASSLGYNTNKEILKYIKSDFSGMAGEYKYNGDGSFDIKQIVKKWNGSKFIAVD